MIHSYHIMKLSLENFLCYTSKSFEIGDVGLFLLQGLNGSGKSSMLKGLYWAWFGNLRKPYHHSFPNKTTKAVLETKEYIITRTRLPNRLVLYIHESQQMLEGEAAQNLIVQILGMTHEQFLLSSYIRPHSRTSLVTLTPSEQLRMIETFTFENDIHNLHSTQLSQIIKERKEKIKYLSQKLEHLTQYYENEKKEFDALTVVEKPSKCVKNKDIEKIQLKYDEVTQTFQRLTSLQQNTDISKWKQLFHQYKTKIQLLKKDIIEISVTEDEVNDFLNEIKKCEELVDSQQKIREKLQEFERVKEQYFEDVKKEIDELKPYILNDDERQACEQAIKTNVLREHCIHSLIKHGLDEEQLRSTRALKYLHLQRSQEKNRLPTTQCPKCKSNVCIIGNELHLSKKSKECESSRSTYEKYECITRAIDTFKNFNVGELLSLQQKYDDHQSRIVKYDALCKIYTNKTLSSILIRMKKGIPESPLKKKLPTLFSLNDKTFTINELHSAKKYGEELMKSICDNKKLQEQIKLNTRKALKIKKEKLVDVPENLDETLSKCINTKEKLRSQLDEMKTLRSQQEKYERWDDYRFKVDKLHKEMKEVKEAMQQSQQRYEAALVCERKHQEAEILSIEEVVDTINALAAEYLDIFFDDEPITIEVSILKKTQKDIKFKVNTSIVYKGVEYVSYEELSQGELVKVNLSYILALNKYFNSPVLMLDEFLENLDTQISIDVTEKLREIARDKCVIIVDHSSIEGMYDNVYSF